ncbi:hypothetical protein, partial [Mesorhizobium sp.]|uniref:hypothetical protein n=1 Tax=Mesorhizobium sp. TaxID=1871066 RepID=UPI0025C37A80
MSAQWRVEQTRLLREIERATVRRRNHIWKMAVRLLELARSASQLFTKSGRSRRSSSSLQTTI